MTYKRLWTDEQLVNAVTKSFSYADVARTLGLRISGGTFTVLKKYIVQLGLSVEHFQRGKCLQPRQSTDAILVENSTYSSSQNLKMRLLKEGLLENKCNECGILEWQGKLLSLHLDHINGIRHDNRIDNLRLLCPNCHSLTPTYCKGWKGLQPIELAVERTPARSCLDCDARVHRQSLRCISCTNALMLSVAKTKIIWPDLDDLEKMVQESSFLAVSKKLGVSDKAVKNRLHKRGRLIQR